MVRRWSQNNTKLETVARCEVAVLSIEAEGWR